MNKNIKKYLLLKNIIINNCIFPMVIFVYSKYILLAVYLIIFQK